MMKIELILHSLPLAKILNLTLHPVPRAVLQPIDSPRTAPANPQNMLIVDFTHENVRIEDARFKVLKEEGERKWLLYRPDELSLVDALSIINHQGQVMDLTVKEPDIEDIVREFYVRNQ